VRATRQIEVAKARENAAPGYHSSGMSEFSRNAGSGIRTPAMASRPRRVVGRPHTLPELIEKTRAEIRHLQAELRITDHQARRRKIGLNIDIKLQFLARLKSESNE
jgi:hypothetical protein